MDPIEDAVPELPQDMWDVIVAFLQEEETLLTMTQVSKGTQNTAEKELTRRWAEQGFVLATGPKELTRALADPEAKVIVTRGGTVDTPPANRDAYVIAAGPVAVTAGVVLVRDTIGTITSVTGGEIHATGSAQVSNVTGGRVYASGTAQVTNATGGIVHARGSAQASNVTDGTVTAYNSTQVTNVSDGHVHATGSARVTNVSGGRVDATGSAQVTDVTNGTVYAHRSARVTATGGVIHARDHASIHSEGAIVHVHSSNATITATGGEIRLHVPNPHITYSGDITFYNDRNEPTDPPKAFGE